jgi:hypothetical protein
MAPRVQRRFKMRIPSADVASRQDPTRVGPLTLVVQVAKADINADAVSPRRPACGTAHLLRCPTYRFNNRPQNQ